MARSFSSASSQYMETSNNLLTFITNSAGSFSCWYYPTSTGGSAANARSLPCIINDSSSNMGMSRGTIGGLDRIWVWNWDGNEDRAGATYTTDTWQQFGWLHSGGTVYVYKNGASAASTASGNTAGDGTTMRAGYGYTGAVYLNGYLAEMAFWNVALSDPEWDSLGDGVSPALIRPASLVAYWPLLGYSSPELCVTDNGLAWTLSGSPTDVDHPRVIYPSRGKLYLPAVGQPMTGRRGSCPVPYTSQVFPRFAR